jgi:hypothetical protein
MFEQGLPLGQALLFGGGRKLQYNGSDFSHLRDLTCMSF